MWDPSRVGVKVLYLSALAGKGLVLMLVMFLSRPWDAVMSQDGL